MGFFSWLTADTEESVINRYAAMDMGMPMKPVYLLQPDGEASIKEESYEGYGDFGGIDAYDWLARRNLSPEILAKAKEIRNLGITLDCGGYYIDKETGKKWAIYSQSPSIIDPAITYFPGTFDEVIPELGMSGNELIQSGRFERATFTVDVPLKFSFDENARYEDLPPSKTCPDQGYFYVDDEEDEDEDEYENEDEDEDENWEEE